MDTTTSTGQPLVTIRGAKQYLREHWEQGTNCPCCGQRVKQYKRKITSAMAWGLIMLHKNAPHRPVHIETFFKHRSCPPSIRGDFAKLRYWELIEPVEGMGAGYYRITPRGSAFARGVLEVPRYCKIYNGEFFGFSHESTNISAALGDKFNLEELLDG